MPTVEFGSRQEANQFRERVGQYLAGSDDRRSKTVEFTRNVPNTILNRAERQAFTSQEGSRPSAGKAKLSESERQSLRRGTGFDWQSHGFGAMAAKSALQERGVTEWQDFYEPGEGVEGALKNLRQSKGQAAQGGGAPLGIGGQRTDVEEMGGGGRRRRQAERGMGQRVQSAKEPALLEADPDAMGFLREERQFAEGGLFDISFGDTGPFGRPQPSGRDFETMQDRHESRSERAQHLDEIRHAPVTRDPLQWSQDPAHWDFPGLDTLDPRKLHETRSERAQAIDESKSAEIADSATEWANNMDSLDLPGIDAEDRLLR